MTEEYIRSMIKNVEAMQTALCSINKRIEASIKSNRHILKQLEELAKQGGE